MYTKKINEIANIVETVKGVSLLNIDPGKATNRTVITFVGEPENVVEAAFLLIQKAQQLIDMSTHKGEHPRMGATDVCPLVPISNITMEEVSNWARILSKKVRAELKIPKYYDMTKFHRPTKVGYNTKTGEMVINGLS